MNLNMFNSIAEILEILILGFSILFILGVIWRVEKRLDTAYKLFLVAIIFALFSKIAGSFLFFDWIYKENIIDISELLFTLFILLGILEMRHLIKKIDGEM